MLVSVVIAIFSERRLLILLKGVTSLQQQTYLEKEIIIIVDNNEKLYNHLKQMKLSGTNVFHNTNEKGLSNSRNLGILNAKGEIIAFIDDDAIPSPTWIENLVMIYKKEKDILAVGGKINPIWSSKKPIWFPKELYWTIGCTYYGMLVGVRENRVRNLIGCNMSFKKTIFDNIGLFRRGLGRIGNYLLGSEEMEYCLRIFSAYGRRKIYYNSNAIVNHFVVQNRKTITYLIKRCFFEGISKSLIEFRFNKFLKQNGKKIIEIRALKGETEYLKFLLIRSLPGHLLHFYRLSNFTQAVVIAMNIVFVGLGYLYGKFIFNRTFNLAKISKKELPAH